MLIDFSSMRFGVTVVKSAADVDTAAALVVVCIGAEVSAFFGSTIPVCSFEPTGTAGMFSMDCVGPTISGTTELAKGVDVIISGVDVTLTSGFVASLAVPVCSVDGAACVLDDADCGCSVTGSRLSGLAVRVEAEFPESIPFKVVAAAVTG